jgi:hypothetical protein
MPIRPFLAGQPFEPELIQQMSLALERVCAKFGMKLADDPATRVVAQKIIELAQRGVRDAPTLTATTLKEFKHRWSDVGRNPPRLVFGKHFRRRSSPRLVLVIDIRKQLSILIVAAMQQEQRREATRCGAQRKLRRCGSGSMLSLARF